MKSSIFTVVAATVGLAAAQFPGIPDCATGCLITAISSVGCALTDIGCQCSSTAQIQGGAAGCIIAGCTKAGEIQQAATNGGAICSSFLATVSASTTSEEETTTLVSTKTETSIVVVQTTSVPSPSKSGYNSTSSITGTGSSSVSRTTSRASTSSGAAPAASSSQVPPNSGTNLAVGVGGVLALFAAFFAL